MSPTPPQGVDRDTLMEAFRFMPEEYRESATAWVLALVRPVEGPSAREIADWFEREADSTVPDDWRLRTARTIRHEWGLS